MSWSSLPANVQEIAGRVLTKKQLEAFEYELHGWSTYRIARRLGLTKGAVVDRLHNAHKNMLNAGVRQDASGEWHVDEEVAA